VLRIVIFIQVLLFITGCTIAGSTATIAENNGDFSSPMAVTELPEPVSGEINMPSVMATMGGDPPTATVIPSMTQPSTPSMEPTVTVTPAVSSTASGDRLQGVSFELAQAVPPVRNDARLAAAFRGLDKAILSTNEPILAEELSPGQRQQFMVLDVVNNTFREIEAELYAVGDHGYFWFETEPYGIVPEGDVLSRVVSVFDEIYEGVTADFGNENSPGIDGDPRLHVLHASPQTICGVPADGGGGCGTAGFVSSPDLQPALLNPQSNEREMFVMNDRQFGSDYYLGVLAHEFRHLIEFNYDLSDMDWEKEGSAVLATELFGLPSGGVERANMFLDDPDQQLNSWTDESKGSYYGQGFLFNQYLYDRLGGSLYRQFAMSPLPGFVALDDIANKNGLDYSGESLWLDWLVALALHEDEQAAEKYHIDVDGLKTVALMPIDTLPGELIGEVRQFAADYHELPLGTIKLSFDGVDTVSLLAGQNLTDEVYWYAQRANYSNPRLTRTLDLRGLETATLVYDVYTDIEQGYDFAYVSISLDDGNTWIPLAAPNMQGLAAEDDPSDSALADRFYSGRNQAWQKEVIDLSPYAGQEVFLRYEMVTDPVLTYSGLAVDNVSVPEIGFFDDGTAEGWTAEGFTSATASLPQPWHLKVITFPDGGPLVNDMPVSPDGQAAFIVSSTEGQRRPILIVAASAPMTLEPATYKLQIDRN
jgi:immune inhibitor A